MEKESEFTKRCLYASSYFREQEFNTILNLKFNFMKQRRFMFKLQSNKAVTLALGLMLGLCPVSRGYAALDDSQIVTQMQKRSRAST